MDSRIFGPQSFAFGVSWRALFIASLAFALLQVLTTTQYYATALVLAGLIALTVLDLTRLYARLDAPSAAERRQAEHAGARQADRNAALLDAVTVALIVVEADGRIILANRAARLLAGEEIGRLADMRALPPGGAVAVAAMPVGARQIITMADGGSMLVWVGAFGAPGMPAQRLISLQRVVGELDAVQITAWQDMTRVLSHEMMNSLTPIASLSESLAHMLRPEGGVDQDVADAVATIGRRSRHLMNFVERYRQIADLPAPRPQSIALARFVADIDSLIQAHFKGLGIAYGSTLTPGDLALHADPDLLSQAIFNLLHNAGDAAAQAKNPAVTLACVQEGNNICFRVSDNGPGIAPEHQQRIFVPFFTTKPGGSGIGLALVRQIALAHGGQIEAQSNDGGGMRFVMTIPAMANG